MQRHFYFQLVGEFVHGNFKRGVSVSVLFPTTFKCSEKFRSNLRARASRKRGRGRKELEILSPCNFPMNCCLGYRQETTLVLPARRQRQGELSELWGTSGWGPHVSRVAEERVQPGGHPARGTVLASLVRKGEPAVEQAWPSGRSCSLGGGGWL